MSHIRRLWRPIAALIAVVWLVVGASTASAFYWHNWPGSGGSGGGGGSNPPPPTPPPETTTGNPETPPGGGGSPHVPEPSTALAGLIGLGAVGMFRWARRKKSA
jgi:MYXO-CTERM domain-containing protein